jgi:hypothetical protein
MKSLMPLFCILFLCRRASSPLQRSAQNRYRLFQFNAYLYENILTKCLDTSRSGSLNAGALIKTGITPMEKKPLAEESKKKEEGTCLCIMRPNSLFQFVRKTRNRFSSRLKGAIYNMHACRLWRKNWPMRANVRQAV